MIEKLKKNHLKRIRSTNGFSAVELLVTLFVAAAFLMSGYQLYAVVIKDGGKAHAQANTSNAAYDYIQHYKTSATNPCTVQTPLTNSPIMISGVFNPTLTVAISCPYGTTSSVSKILATINYDTPQQTITNAIFINQSPSVPTEPTSLTATGGIGQIALNWVAPANNGGAPITGYRIYRGSTTNSETILTTVGNVLSYTNTGLASSMTYYYKVAAINKIGEGIRGNEISGVTSNVVNLTFPYTGAVQSWTVPATGTYKLEVWGAQGGGNYVTAASATDLRASGGYAYGKVYLTQGQILYIYVGSKGTYGVSGGGWNGGGNGSTCGWGQTGAGGGATDIRTISGAWDDLTSLNSRIIVAGGGGGSNYQVGGNGGGLVGAQGQDGASYGYGGSGGTQIAGGAAGILAGYASVAGFAGSFGKGGIGVYSGASGGSAGGGGWYGGGSASAGGSYGGAGGGGSSYIAGLSDSGTVEGQRIGDGQAIITN